MNCGICNQDTDLWEDGGVICEDCADKPRYRYYSILRPPGPFAVPDGWCLREYWRPKQEVPGTHIHAHGWVEYPKGLPFNKVFHYDLLPANMDELREYRKWEETR